jgi:hypothetical protein
MPKNSLVELKSTGALYITWPTDFSITGENIVAPLDENGRPPRFRISINAEFFRVHQIPAERPDIEEQILCEIQLSGITVGESNTLVHIPHHGITTGMVKLWSGDIDLTRVIPVSAALLKITISQSGQVLKTEQHRILWPGARSLDSIDEHKWMLVVRDLNQWHYVTERERPWLGATVGDSEEIIENKLRQTGYHGGALRIRSVSGGDGDAAHLFYDSEYFEDPHHAEITYLAQRAERWHHLVNEEVNDWLRRLSGLRAMVTGWVSDKPALGLSVQDEPPILMHESLMKQFQVQQAQMPAFKVSSSSSQRVALFRPLGLWVVGANGRVDVITKSEVAMLVDLSEPMSAEPNWKIYRKTRSGLTADFTESEFLGLVGISE